MLQNEKCDAADTCGALVSTPVSINEQAEAHGTYHAECIGPVESFRATYCALRDRLNAAGLKGAIDRLFNGKRLMQEFMAIPLELKWADTAKNVVCTIGKNLALDTYLAGSAYTVTGPYMFLINTNASAAVAGDTMASHAGWLEVGNANNPDYSGTRKTCAWNAASAGSKALSAALSFAILNAGSVGGCGIVFGAGAVNTIDSTAGTLYSAGAFTGGTKIVDNGDTLNVSYSTGL